MPPAVKSSMLPNIDILGSVIGDYLAMQMPGILLCGLVDMSAIDPQVTTLPICVSFFTMIHLARVIPPSLSKAALKCFDEEVRKCFIIEIPDGAWSQAQLGLKYGGLGLPLCRNMLLLPSSLR